ncbi:hypothetical protein DPEC_G00282840 [Dallia pectoralis]|uniref:Uncharacterized protein n=1 Tax=Dallia pectoralis TaxID=75939 RepID=A0ACC2FJ17_DALPE|nr:hypothetical protein DPEC_G00282840 [Dallia pectoralis]
MISTLIVQGGEPPAFLAPHVVDYIVTGDILQVHVTPDEIANTQLRDGLKKVKQADTEDALEEAVKCCDSWRFDVEGLPNLVTFDTKQAFVENATLYFVLLQRQSCLDQFIDGLTYYEVLPLLRENPSMRIILDMPAEKNNVSAEVVAGV